jgi:cell division protease FtsH
VTKQAYTMVAYYGLNKEIGNVSFYDSTGRAESSFTKPYSEATAQKIDTEVSKLVERAYAKTKALLIKHRDQMDALAARLLEKEVVFQNDLEDIFGKRTAGVKETEAKGTEKAEEAEEAKEAKEV